jgi:hypothetical protein
MRVDGRDVRHTLAEFSDEPLHCLLLPLKALLPILLPALERNGHLKLDEEIRPRRRHRARAIDELAALRRWRGVQDANGGLLVIARGRVAAMNSSKIRRRLSLRAAAA